MRRVFYAKYWNLMSTFDVCADFGEKWCSQITEAFSKFDSSYTSWYARKSVRATIEAKWKLNQEKTLE